MTRELYEASTGHFAALRARYHSSRRNSKHHSRPRKQKTEEEIEFDQRVILRVQPNHNDSEGSHLLRGTRELIEEIQIDQSIELRVQPNESERSWRPDLTVTGPVHPDKTPLLRETGRAVPMDALLTLWGAGTGGIVKRPLLEHHSNTSFEHDDGNDSEERNSTSADIVSIRDRFESGEVFDRSIMCWSKYGVAMKKQAGK